MFDFFNEHWGDLASVIGMALALWAARSAQSAKIAAEEARASINHIDALSAIREVTTLLKETKTLHRHDLWEAALYSYSHARQLVSTVRYGSNKWSEEQLRNLTGMVGQLCDMEKQVENYLVRANGRKPPLAKVNNILSNVINALNDLEGHLRSQDSKKERDNAK